MSDRARRKEKQRLKRKQKQLALRKAKSASPIRQIAHLADSLDCWINGNWKEQGMANLLVFGETRGGRGAMAAFLIDIWCVGLKDAWGRHEISRVEFRTETVDRAAEAMPMRRISVEDARSLLAGAIRFSQQNRFRLPRHYDRWTAIFGELGDVASADLRHFGKDGGLLFSGDVNFLHQRYTGGPAEEFLNREDVHWVMPPDEVNALYHSDDYADEDDSEYEDEGSEMDEASEPVGALVDSMLRNSLALVQNWCFREGKTPHQHLESAMILLLSGMSAAMLEAAKGRENEYWLGFMRQIVESQRPDIQAQLLGALQQVAEYAEKYGWPFLECPSELGRISLPEPDMLNQSGAPTNAT